MVRGVSPSRHHVAQRAVRHSFSPVAAEVAPALLSRAHIVQGTPTALSGSLGFAGTSSLAGAASAHAIADSHVVKQLIKQTFPESD